MYFTFRTTGTAGVFWMNAAETWVDIYNNTELNSSSPGSAAHFMSESGIVDAFILLGELPQNTFKQYSDLTGVVPLPQQGISGIDNLNLISMQLTLTFEMI